MRIVVLFFAVLAILAGILVVPVGMVNGFVLGSDRLGTLVILGGLCAVFAFLLMPRRKR